MNVYLISQDVNNKFDTYDSAVVIANNEEQAKKIHPESVIARGRNLIMADEKGVFNDSDNWALNTDQVQVKLIGVADGKYKEPCVICASYNAG